MEDKKKEKQETASIRSIQIRKGASGIPVTLQSAMLRKGAGIEGDIHGTKQGRELAFLDMRTKLWMQEETAQGLCFHRFQENFLTEGLDYARLSKGDRFQIGTSIVKVTQVGKRCFSECVRRQKNTDCMLWSNVFFAKVSEDGIVKEGDCISRIELPERLQENRRGLQVHTEERYLRQTGIKDIGLAGQERLKESSVLVVGAGGLGCPAITSLAAAGVGKIGIVDKDVIEPANLNRQFLYTPFDVGKSKARKAGEWLAKFSPECQAEVHEWEVTQENAAKLIAGYDIFLIALDTVEARMILNAAACKMGKPFVDGAVDGLYGTVTAMLAKEDACLCCLNPEGEEPLHTGNSFCPVTMTVGAAQAQIALLYLAGARKQGGVWSYDGRNGCLEQVPLKKNAHCNVCGNPI